MKVIEMNDLFVLRLNDVLETDSRPFTKCDFWLDENDSEDLGDILHGYHIQLKKV